MAHSEHGRIVVLAGNYQQFRECCRENGWGPNAVVYASRPEFLHGLSGVRVVRYGTWRERPDAAALDGMCRYLEARSPRSLSDD